MPARVALISALSAARSYLKIGLHPIPCEPGGKRPLIPWKEFIERAPTEDELSAWWAQSPDANVALVLVRGMFAVDIDGPEGEAAVAAAGITFPFSAPEVKTGKGRHVFLSGDVPDRIGVLDKVDIRSAGGYVIAPPSLHPSGARYSWITSMTADLAPPAPAALLALLARPTRPTPDQKPANWLVSALAGAGEGQRDQTCTRLAGYFLGKGVPVEAVECILEAWADRCTPPFPADQAAKCVASIAKLEPATPAQESIDVSLILDRTLAELHGATQHTRATAIPGIDKLLDGGFRSGDYVLMGSRPSVGKTTLALQWARKIAKSGVGVLIVSREMTDTSLVRRLLVQESSVRASAVRSGTLIPLEWDMLNLAVERLRPLPLWITTSAISIDQIAEAVAKFLPHELKLVVVDYIQLVRPPGDIRDRRAGIEYVSQELKTLAVRHDLTVLALSSLSRPPKDAGQNWRPQLSDLRESGELEHDADQIFLLHRKFSEDVCEVNLAKQRDGRIGLTRLKFSGELLTFEEIGG